MRLLITLDQALVCFNLVVWKIYSSRVPRLPFFRWYGLFVVLVSKVSFARNFRLNGWADFGNDGTQDWTCNGSFRREVIRLFNLIGALGDDYTQRVSYAVWWVNDEPLVRAFFPFETSASYTRIVSSWAMCECFGFFLLVS